MSTFQPVEIPISELARQKLRQHPNRALKKISCEFKDGVLILRGRLPSFYLKQVTQEIVVRLDGIERIDNQIEVIRETT